MRRLTVAAALALISIAAPNVALADAKADVAKIKACLAGKAEDPRACIGNMSELCQATPAGQTMDGSVACVEQEEAAWDAILNERYKAELAAATSMESDLKSQPDSQSQPVVAPLKTAQRAWIAYRDAECLRRYNYYQSGTYRFDAHANCQRDLTAARAIDVSASQD